MKSQVEKEASTSLLSVVSVSKTLPGPTLSHSPPTGPGASPVPLVPVGQFSQGCLVGQSGPVREQR